MLGKPSVTMANFPAYMVRHFYEYFLDTLAATRQLITRYWGL